MKLLLSSFLCLFIGLAYGQQQLPAGQNFYDEENTGYIYSQELSFDFKILTPRAFAFGVNVGKLLSYDRTRFYNFEFGDLRHSLEYRQNLDRRLVNSNRVSRGFIFGKQNNAFVLRAGMGEKRYFSEKAKNKGLAVGASYQIGANLGIIKPYYLEILRAVDPGSTQVRISEERYSPENENLFTDLNSIMGSASFSQGLSEISIMPGFHAKAAAHFDWGAFEELVKAVEAGIQIDVFFKDVPIMIESPNLPNVENSPIFINLYLNLQLGKRS
jgi:hypothetical protein